jgi:hypothetical protein
MDKNLKREKEVSKLLKDITKNETSTAFVDNGVDTSDYLLVKGENASLRMQIENLENEIKELNCKFSTASKELELLREKTKHNARNAGRKKMYKTDKFKRFVELYERNISLKDISNRMNISMRSAYYYQKEYKIYKTFEESKKQGY